MNTLPRCRLPVLCSAIALAVSSPCALHAQTVDLDLATNNPNPVTLADSQTTYTFGFSSFGIEYLIVAGGGGGGPSGNHQTAGGGGGAGGFLEGTTDLSGGSKVIVVGNGGAGAPGVFHSRPGDKGEDSSAFGFTAVGGGGGGWYAGGGTDGGSGGGAAARGSTTGGTAGAGTAGPPLQGYAGGVRAAVGTTIGAASGGGAGGEGIATTSNVAGRPGGAGVSRDITGESKVYAAGGGGGAGGATGGVGGQSQTGGKGGDRFQVGSNADANTGGGGGGGGSNITSAGRDGGRGGSGIVVVRYEGPRVFNGGEVTTVGDDTVHQFKTTGPSALGFLATLAGDVDGDGHLELNAQNSVLTLTGDLKHSGTTTVSAGTLILVGGNHESPIIVNDGAKIGFTLGSPVTSTQTVTLDSGHAIVINGTVDNTSDYLLMTAGQFIAVPALDSGIENYDLEVRENGTQLWLAYSEPGSTPYEIWAGEGLAFGDDANNDGISNGLAFLLGATSPTSTDALGLLPKPSENNSALELGFKMRANRGNAKLHLQYSNSLQAGAWTTVPVPDTEGQTVVGPVTFNVIPGTPLNTVTAAISAEEANGGKLFGRCSATEN